VTRAVQLQPGEVLTLKWLYRITLVVAGCYFESAIRNVTEMVLYWIRQPNLVRGLVPYILPVLLGYVYALEVRGEWSRSRLKNDIMAYMGSTVLIGYPLLLSISFWIAGSDVSREIATIRTVSTIVLLANLTIAALVWRDGVRKGYPFSLPWGPETGVAEPVVGVDQVEPGVADAGAPTGEAEARPGESEGPTGEVRPDDPNPKPENGDKAPGEGPVVE
jgi:hypothetical protein